MDQFNRYINMLKDYAINNICTPEEAYENYYAIALHSNDLKSLEFLEENKEDLIYKTTEDLYGL